MAPNQTTFLCNSAMPISLLRPRFYLAEGEGRNAVYLAQQGHDVIGVDSSKVGLDKAQKLAKERGVAISTVVADLKEYDIGEDKWDAVVSIFCHMPPPMRKDVHSKIVRGLKPGAYCCWRHIHLSNWISRRVDRTPKTCS